jgi:hypothetical protein
MEEYPEYFEGKGAIQRKFKDGTRKSVKAKNKYHQKNRQDEDEEPKNTTLPQKWSAKNFTPSSSEGEEEVNDEIIEKMTTPLKKDEIEGEEVLEERYSMDDIEHHSEDSDHSDKKKDKKKKNGKKSKSKKEKN